MHEYLPWAQTTTSLHVIFIDQSYFKKSSITLKTRLSNKMEDFKNKTKQNETKTHYQTKNRQQTRSGSLALVCWPTKGRSFPTFLCVHMHARMYFSSCCKTLLPMDIFPHTRMHTFVKEELCRIPPPRYLTIYCYLSNLCVGHWVWKGRQASLALPSGLSWVRLVSSFSSPLAITNKMYVIGAQRSVTTHTC